MNLVIVESPTKARKLRSYLGDGYHVEASVGHIRDLPTKKIGVDVENDFEPTYEVSSDKKKVIKQLQGLASEAEIIYLATDPDREGEAIAWHLSQLLGAEKSGKKKKDNSGGAILKRATFHEITKQAVTDAIANPSMLNMALVDAQQARRVVDRLVGYETSPVLWRKVRRGLSAGRVQSVALRLIVDREKEIIAFIPEEYWEVDVALSSTKVANSSDTHHIFKDGQIPKIPPGGMLIARVIELQNSKYQPTAQSDVTPVTQWLPAATFTVKSVEKKERTQQSFPPFTTSTLQQAAANRLGMTSKQTMRLAQQLYEEGLITYHRTDSFNLSVPAVESARSFIAKAYGPQFVPDQPRRFANRSKNAQEAHEAIRVTDVAKADILGVSNAMTGRHQQLYDLIRRRFLASQMAAAVYDQATVTITALGMGDHSDASALLRTTGSVQKFAGWRTLFPAGDDVILPDVSQGQELDFADLNAAQKFTQPPPRYNDASLVKELEKRGIGRPSTYASIISVIIDRGYVERIEKRFHPSDIGIAVSDFLLQHFRVFMEYDFTAEMEENLDKIARGEKEWRSVVRAFYTPFHETVEKTKDQAERVKMPVESTGEVCPECGGEHGGEIVIRSGRFGKFKSCSRFPECRFTQNIVEKFGEYKCPKCGEGDIIIKKSRWGKPFYGCNKYPKCDWASWNKPEVGPDGKIILVEQPPRKAKAAGAKSAKTKWAKTKSAKSKPAKTKSTTTKSAKPKSAKPKSSKPKSSTAKSTKAKKS